jgi:hypothetical protein
MNTDACSGLENLDHFLLQFLCSWFQRNFGNRNELVTDIHKKIVYLENFANIFMEWMDVEWVKF